MQTPNHRDLNFTNALSLITEVIPQKLTHLLFKEVLDDIRYKMVTYIFTENEQAVPVCHVPIL